MKEMFRSCERESNGCLATVNCQVYLMVKVWILAFLIKFIL